MNNKEIAIDFLQMIANGNIDEAYAKYVDMSGKHHNLFTTKGFPVLLQGMKTAHLNFPNKQLVIQRSLSDGDMVAIHSHMILKPDEKEFTTVHLFRFQNGKIYEMWDIAQDITQALNEDGAF